MIDVDGDVDDDDEGEHLNQDVEWNMKKAGVDETVGEVTPKLKIKPLDIHWQNNDQHCTGVMKAAKAPVKFWSGCR